MFKKLKHFICKLFNIKACMCDEVDEHIEYFTEIPEPDVPVQKPKHCGSHTRFIKSCHQCIALIQ
jgi:hypothetical protein